MKTSKGSDTSEKKYLSIGEVAAKFNISIEVLRKWEKDFPRVLKPMRSSGDSRLYDRKQQNNVAMILHLLREEGLSIEGAKRKLSNKLTDEEIRQEVITRLKDIRAKIMDIANEIENLEHKTDAPAKEGVVWTNK